MIALRSGQTTSERNFSLTGVASKPILVILDACFSALFAHHLAKLIAEG
jgi:hypothetical protein